MDIEDDLGLGLRDTVAVVLPGQYTRAHVQELSRILHNDNAVVISVRQRLRALGHIHRRLMGRSTGVFEYQRVLRSPEPNRNGLTINRVRRQALSSMMIIDGRQAAATSNIPQLLKLHQEDPDLALVATQSATEWDGVVTRVHADAILLAADSLHIIGDLDESFSEFQDVIDDICGRLVKASMPIGALRGTRMPLRDANPPVHPRLCEQFPWLSHGPLHQRKPCSSPDFIHLSQQGLRQNNKPGGVVVDLRRIFRVDNGTGRHALFSLEAIASAQSPTRVLTSSNTDPTVVTRAQALGCLTVESNAAPTTGAVERSLVAYLPIQAEGPEEVHELRAYADFVVVGQLDFIAIDNPSYHSTIDQWAHLRHQSLEGLNAADGVVWLSEAVARSARRIHLNMHTKPSVVAGSVVAAPQIDHVSPSAIDIGKPYIATIGSAYHHKARLHSFAVMKHLVDQGWAGTLVLAGWPPPHGSSLDEEDEFLDRHPSLRHRVTRLENLSPSDLAHLISNAQALLQPSVCEGFGLLPFEAALLGTPTFVTRRTSSRDLIPDEFRGWLSLHPRSDALLIHEHLRQQYVDVVPVLLNVAVEHNMMRLGSILSRFFGTFSSL